MNIEWVKTAGVTSRFSSLPRHRCGSVATLNDASWRVGFLADVAHSEDARWVPGLGGSGDVADVFAVQRQRRIRLGHRIAGEEQFDAAAVYLAAGADALDNLLAGVAAFGVADVAVLQAGFVRDLFFAEVIAEPWDALGEPQSAQRCVAHGPATMPSRRFRKNLPKVRQVS